MLGGVGYPGAICIIYKCHYSRVLDICGYAVHNVSASKHLDEFYRNQQHPHTHPFGWGFALIYAMTPDAVHK